MANPGEGAFVAEWEALEAGLRRPDQETEAWSRAQLGGDVAHFANAYHIARRALVCLEQVLTVSPWDDPVTRQYRAVQLQTEFAFRRLLNAWGLLLQGYHFDARGLQRVAWEAVNRAGYYILNEGTGEEFLNNHEHYESKVRNFLSGKGRDMFPERWKVTGDVLTQQWNNLSPYLHTYKLGALIIQADLNGEQLTLTPFGVRKRDELYFSFYLDVFMMLRLAGVLSRSAIHLMGEWPADLSQQLDRSEQDRRQLDERIRQEFSDRFEEVR